MSKELAVTTKTGTSGWGFAKNVLSKIWDYASPFVAPLAAGFAASKGMPIVSGAIMYGAGVRPSNDGGLISKSYKSLGN